MAKSNRLLAVWQAIDKHCGFDPGADHENRELAAFRKSENATAGIWINSRDAGLRAILTLR